LFSGYSGPPRSVFPCLKDPASSPEPLDARVSPATANDDVHIFGSSSISLPSRLVFSNAISVEPERRMKVHDQIARNAAAVFEGTLDQLDRFFAFGMKFIHPGLRERFQSTWSRLPHQVVVPRALDHP